MTNDFGLASAQAQYDAQLPSTYFDPGHADPRAWWDDVLTVAASAAWNQERVVLELDQLHVDAMGVVDWRFGIIVEDGNPLTLAKALRAAADAIDEKCGKREARNH